MIRTLLICSFTAAAVALVACSGGDDSNNGSGNGSGNGNGTGNGNGSGSSSFKDCSAQTQAGTCTEADMKPYADCMMTACDSKYKECYGPNYRSGQFSGACGTYITCIQKCDCNDDGCKQACTQDQACADCSKGFLGCVGSCTLPECATGGAGGTCADLEACCATLEGTDKTQCDQMKGVGVDLACGSLLSTFKASGKCN